MIERATSRRAFFHNGVYHTLQQVLRFYNFCATQPKRIYPRRRDGRVAEYDDLPRTYQGNVGTAISRGNNPRPVAGNDESRVLAKLALRYARRHNENYVISAPAFGRRNVATYFFAFLTSESSSAVLQIAVAWTVYGIHHRPFDLGLVGLVTFVPSLLLVFVAGHAVDQFDRKRIVMLAASGVAVCAFVLAALAFAHIVSLPLMLGVLFCQGVARAFGSPAERTILVNIVETSAYMRVQARYASAREIVQIAAPALAGALVAISNVAAFVIAGLLTIGAVIGFSLLHVRATVRTNTGISADKALDGVRFVRSKPIVLGAISLDLFAVLFGGATALLPVYADQILHAGAVAFGMLRSASGLGASVMAIVLSRWTPNRRVGRTMLIAVAGYGVAIIAFAYSRNLWFSIAALAAAGALDMISVVIRRGLVALNTPDAMRGRVASIESVFIQGSAQLGAFESGTAAQIFGPILGVALGGLATLGVVVTWALAFPALRTSNRLDGSEG